MWYGSKYSMAVQAEMLCLFSRSLPPARHVTESASTSSNESPVLNSWCWMLSLTPWLSPKVKRGSPYRPTVMTELPVCFPWLFFFSRFKDAELSRCQRHGGIQTCFHSIQKHERLCTACSVLLWGMKVYACRILQWGWSSQRYHFHTITRSLSMVLNSGDTDNKATGPQSRYKMWSITLRKSN